MRAFSVCFFGFLALTCSNVQHDPTPAPQPVRNTPEIQCRDALFGCPTGTPETNNLIVREFYTLSSNDDTKFADWVAYRLDVSMVDGPSVSRNWKADPLLSDEETLEPADYAGAYAILGTDRGHQAPLASFRGTGLAHQTNFLSNITPQKSALNRGAWRSLEGAVRNLARTRVCYVVTGPLYEQNMPSLPGADEPHRIPSGYWKIVAVGEPGNPASVKAASFILLQSTPSGTNFRTHIVTIDEVEGRSGLDFFRDLPDGVEDSLERTIGTWPLQ